VDWNDFLSAETTSRDTIDVKRVYIDMAGGPAPGIMLSQILYYFLPTRQNQIHPELVERDGLLWLARARDAWWEEVRLTPDQADRVLDKLADRNLVECRVYYDSDGPVKHVRIREEEFLKSFLSWSRKRDDDARGNATISSRNHDHSYNKEFLKNKSKEQESSLRSDLSAFPEKADEGVAVTGGQAATPPISKPSMNSQKWEVFHFWKETLGKNGNAVFNADRQSKVEARIREGYDVERLKRAVLGCRASPHHMGANDQGVPYNGLELICRNGSKVEFFEDIYEAQQHGTAGATAAGNTGRRPDRSEVNTARTTEIRERIASRKAGGADGGHPGQPEVPLAEPADGAGDGRPPGHLRLASAGGARRPAVGGLPPVDGNPKS
jgi:hypothetical protein